MYFIEILGYFSTIYWVWWTIVAKRSTLLQTVGGCSRWGMSWLGAGCREVSRYFISSRAASFSPHPSPLSGILCSQWAWSRGLVWGVDLLQTLKIGRVVWFWSLEEPATPKILTGVPLLGSWRGSILDVYRGYQSPPNSEDRTYSSDLRGWRKPPSLGSCWGWGGSQVWS